LIYLFGPSKGLIANVYRDKRQKNEVMLLTFLLHLHQHSDKEERSVQHLNYHFSWSQKQAKKILKLAVDNGLIYVENPYVNLTEKGEKFNVEAINYILSNQTEKVERMKQDFLLFRG